MKFELRIKIDGWNEYIINYEQDDYQKLIVYLQSLLDEFNQKQKDKKWDLNLHQETFYLQ